MTRDELQREVVRVWRRVYPGNTPPKTWALELCTKLDLERELDRLNMILEMRKLPSGVHVKRGSGG